MTKPMNYYDRREITHVDGTPIFQSAEDRSAEAEVAKEIEVAWGCTISRFGALSAVDWYAIRHGRLVGVLELKSRSHDLGKFSTVFLNVRKWLALSLASAGLGAPAVFVVRFTDCTRWVPLSDVDAGRMKIGGCVRRVKSDNDVEPVIEVGVEVLRPL